MQQSYKIIALCALMSGGAQASDLITVFNDAVENDPQYRAAVQRDHATRELTPQAWALLKPTVTASGNISYFDRTVESAGSGVSSNAFQNSDGTTSAAQLDINQPIFNGQAIAALGQAKRTVKQSEVEVRAAWQDLQRRVAATYFLYQRAQDDLVLAQAEEKAISEQLDEANERYEVGLSAITDKVEAQARFDLTRASRLLAEQAVSDAEGALFELTAHQYESLANLPAPTEAPKPLGDVQQWLTTAMTHNALLRQAELAVEIADKEVSLQRAKHYPVVSANARYAYDDTTDTSFGSESNTKSLTLGVEIPIYEGGAAQSRVREAKYKYQVAKFDLDRQRRAVKREVEEHFRSVNTIALRIDALLQAVRSSEVALEAIDAGYDVGTRTSVDVLNARREVFRAKRDLAAAQYDYLAERTHLQYAVGTLAEENLLELNALLVVGHSEE